MAELEDIVKDIRRHEMLKESWDFIGFIAGVKPPDSIDWGSLRKHARELVKRNTNNLILEGFDVPSSLTS